MRPVQPSLDRTRPTRGLLPLAVLVLVSLLALTACGEDAVTYPTGDSEVVLRVESGGGFVPVEYNLTQTPSFTLYGDGTVIVTGPMIEIYPQPAMPNLQQTTVSQDDMDKLLSAAREAGLFTNGIDYGTPSVADAPTTTVTVNVNDETYVSSIYALGFELFGDIQSDDAATIGLTPDQAEARSAVWEFTAKTGDLDAFLGESLDWRQYAFTSLAVFSVRADYDATSSDDGIQPNRLDWPLDDLGTMGEPAPPAGYRRLVVSGDDLDELRPLLNEATRITLWNSGYGEYYLYFRPLLPDENA